MTGFFWLQDCLLETVVQEITFEALSDSEYLFDFQFDFQFDFAGFDSGKGFSNQLLFGINLWH